MLLGLHALAFFLLPSQHSIWEIFTIYSDSWLFIADWQVLDLGMKGRTPMVETSWSHGLPDLPRSVNILSACLWDLPGFPAGPAWEGPELCNRTGSKGDKRVGILASLQDTGMG